MALKSVNARSTRENTDTESTYNEVRLEQDESIRSPPKGGGLKSMESNLLQRHEHRASVYLSLFLGSYNKRRNHSFPSSVVPCLAPPMSSRFQEFIATFLTSNLLCLPRATGDGLGGSPAR